MQQRKGFFGRLADLWRGIWGVRMTEAEVKNAEAVYHNALNARRRHHDALKEAAGKLLYLRNRAEAELKQHQRDLELVKKALGKAALADEDGRALLLMDKERQLEEAIARCEEQRAQLAGQAEAAKESLAKLASAIDALRTERQQMLARKAHAEARVRARAAYESAVSGGSLEEEALENVREAIARLEDDAGLSPSAHEGGISLTALRKEAQEESDRERLLALKMELRGRMLPEPKRQPFASVQREEVAS